MTKLSRRQFITSCFFMAASGLCVGSISLSASCRKDEKRADIAVDFEPRYVKLHMSGELKKRGEELWNIMASCRLCPRQCGANRLSGDKGFCGSNSELFVAAYHPHFGEEKSLVGKGGSGTIFLSNCNLRCVFCINWEISQGGVGRKNTMDHLATMMLNLQGRGCHNINFVTPTHYSPHIILALDSAVGRGLRLPVVYNTSGWERMDILKKLEGIVDIYLPDFKYADERMAAKYSSGALTYPKLAKAALTEMHRQAGVAKPAEDGLLYRGLIIRHLVMPNNVSGTKQVIEWIGVNLPKDTYFNLMSQYRPAYKAHEYSEISRSITGQEYLQAVEWAKQAKLTNLHLQG